MLLAWKKNKAHVTNMLKKKEQLRKTHFLS